MTSSSQADSRDWAEVQRLLDELVDLQPAERVAELDRREPSPAIAKRVRELLSALDESPDYLEARSAPLPASATPVASLAEGTQIGLWRIERLLGRGGMGEVYLAKRADDAFEQRVAIKLVGAHAVAHIGRFHEERRILASLEHPGIARLLDGGVAADGRPYMAMEYVDGLDIAAWCREHALDLNARLQLFGQICEAVRYAHSLLVVHRDLKPHNILVTRQGQAKLLDFGIARLIDVANPDAATDAATRTQQLLTPEYASPEQLEGAPVSLATDVYALGLLLFELLTGRSPWRQTDSAVPTMIRRILEGDPLAPSRIAPLPPDASAKSPPLPIEASRLRGDLDAITLKALRREPQQRYETAALLWADVQRYLRGEPVLARAATPRYLLSRFVRRHRALVGAAAIVLVTSLVGVAGIALQARETAIERDNAQRQVARLQAVQDYLQLMFRTASQQQSGDQPLTAKSVLDRSAAELMERFDGDPTLRANMLFLLGQLYVSLSDYPGALPLLQRYESLPEIRADAAHHADVLRELATTQLRLGQFDAARASLTAAQAIWAAGPTAAWEKLSSSRSIEVELAYQLNQPEAAIASLRQALSERDRHLPEGDDITLEMLNSLAAILANVAQLDEARSTADRAWSMMEKRDQMRTPQALTLMNTRATVAALQKRSDDAIALYKEAIDLRRALYGPSASLATLELNIARALLKVQRGAEAVPWLVEAEPMAVQYTGEDSMVTLGTRQAHADALVQIGRASQAEPIQIATLKTIERLKGARSLEYMRGLIGNVELRIAQHRFDEADRVLKDIESRVIELGPAAQINASRLVELRELVNAKRSPYPDAPTTP